MRLEKSLKNTITSLFLELVSIVSGLILPRLILSHYGSTYNGLISSVSQFISCAALLKSGINSVTRAALYKALAVGDNIIVNRIVNASSHFLRKVAFIFLGMLILMAGLYPLLVADEFGWLFTATLILIIGVSSFFQYCFGVTYHTLIKADQREYIYTLLHIGTVLANLLISVVLIENGFGIHAVKLGSSIVYTLNPLFLSWYVHRHYKLDKAVPADMSLISQRWDAFGHQIATFIHSNTDIIVLTIFTSTATVSVYNIYYLAVVVIRKIVTSLSSGMEAALGNILASEDKEYVRRRFESFEMLIYGVSIILYSVSILLITPFVLLYTEGVYDTNYCQPIFAVVLIAAEFFNSIRIPYQTISNAAGQYKNTKKWAYAEAIINITVSLIAVNIWGLVGVAIGTVVAMIVRTINYMLFSSKVVIERNIDSAIVKMLASVVLTMVIVIFGNFGFNVLDITFDNWFTWIIGGGISVVSASAFLVVFAVVFCPRSAKDILKIFKSLLRIAITPVKKREK